MGLATDRENDETNEAAVPTQMLIVGTNRDGHHRMVATSIQHCGAAHFFIGDV